MKGIDIYHGDKGINPARNDIDFCIVKATEGRNYVDDCFEGFASTLMSAGKPWGFYHFARENDAQVEARDFHNATKAYSKKAIPVLDYENDVGAAWCERFIDSYQQLSGVYPMLYISASRCQEFANSWIPGKCPLWVAGYPKARTDWISDTTKLPYNIKPWSEAAIWQFTSSLKLSGFSGSLDGNIAYIDTVTWSKYAGSAATDIKPVPTEQPIDDIVRDVLNGKYGTGQTRRALLGGRYQEVQKRINELYKVADLVIDGKYGNGTIRKNRLSLAGYPYDIVQKIVNEKLRYTD